LYRIKKRKEDNTPVKTNIILYMYMKSREGSPLQNDVSLYNLKEEGEGRPTCCKETIIRANSCKNTNVVLYCRARGG
jgi:hypothetical protein